MSEGQAKNSGGMRAILYARVSKDDTHNDDRNLNGQLDMCRDYAVSRGYVVVAELAEDDRGVSGAEFELEQLTRALDMARKGAADVLVTRELDRFARRLAKQLIVEEEFKRAGVTVEYVLGEYPDTPEGGLLKNVRATIAEYEREKIRERMIRGKHQKVKAGSVMINGKVPYGYTLVESDKKWTLRIDQREARVIRLVFNWYVFGAGDEGPLGIIGIVRRLNKMKIATYADTHPDTGHQKIKKRGWGEWSRSAVHHILTNETYAGTWRFRKVQRDGDKLKPVPAAETLPVEVPAIITRELWCIAQDEVRRNRPKIN